jgi:hypothetical protein
MAYYNSHSFFCNETDCNNMTTYYGATCYDCCVARYEEDCGSPRQNSIASFEAPEGCPGCGYVGATLVGQNGYCGGCWEQRYGCEEAKPHWCGHLDCAPCQSEYYEQCGGCGKNGSLWDHRYCKECYDDRYVAKVPVLPPSPEPEYRCPEDVLADIERITAKLEHTRMTPRQQADWKWLLGNREEELARMEAEMWEGYDKDDLRKMDQNMRML